MKGTKVYDNLWKAYQDGLPVPKLVSTDANLGEPTYKDYWANNFEDTIERVISYWSKTIQATERNYSPTEREALALKEGLITF